MPVISEASTLRTFARDRVNAHQAKIVGASEIAGPNEVVFPSQYVPMRVSSADENVWFLRDRCPSRGSRRPYGKH